ncbi:RES family NAD+ phosphorylase [Roseateles sp. PN1]|uniref:RES family NAD+ phosphorylase n=1 Tax=Roseateles sp. PN1 TaxID=3137372 RepID=UPI00313902E0
MNSNLAYPTTQLHWPDSCRLIPSRFPPISLFERVCQAADLDLVFAIEAIGNPRLRDEVGELSLVPAEQRLSGPGCSAIMAAFTHLNPDGSRFSDGSYGVYYAAADLDTAVAEVSYHQARFLACTQEAAIDVDMRCYRVTVSATLHDLRGLGSSLKHRALRAVYDPLSYAASQALGAQLRVAGSLGLVYDSVRKPGGQCLGLFNPQAATPPARQAEHVTLRWDGTGIHEWYLKSGHHRI